MNRRLAPSALSAACLVILSACSARTTDVRRTVDAPRPVAAGGSLVRVETPPADRPVRPIPEVIARAKPFRLADAVREASAARPVGGFGPTVAPVVLPATAIVASPESAPSFRGGVADTAGIRGLLHDYLQAFNRHDAAAVASLWSDSGQNVNLDTGETTGGRAAVHEVFAALFEQDATARIAIDVTSIRGLREDVALVDGVSRLTCSDAATNASRFTAIVVRQADGWVLDSVRESAVPVDEPAAATSGRPLDEIAWLLGAWEDAGEGVTASTQCAWSRDRAFLIRSHAVTVNAGAERPPAAGDSRIPGLLPAGSTGSREITEIIGWDPVRGQVRSWLFTSAGRFAEGTWSREGEAWVVRVEEVIAGGTNECLYTITRMGPDEMACRCSGDRDLLADVLPPACDYLRTARPATPTP